VIVGSGRRSGEIKAEVVLVGSGRKRATQHKRCCGKGRDQSEDSCLVSLN